MRKFLILWEEASINRRGERIEVTGSTTRTSIPVRYIESVVSFGNVRLSPSAMSLLIKNRVPVFFLTRFGRIKAVLWTSYLTSNNSNRLRQFRAHISSPLKVAKRVVEMKVRSIEKHFNINLSELREGIARARDTAELLGIEGTASRLMFEKFSENIKGCGFSFGGRSYHPPPDPVNALLSLSYTFAHNLCLPLVLLLGYDPYVSFLHTKRGTHSAFCSDLLEPARPFITKKLEEPLLRGVFKKKDFKKEREGWYLKKESFGKFLQWLEPLKEDLLGELKESISSVSEALNE